MDKIIQWVKQDPVRVEALQLVSQLALPQCYIAAGFVRNLVWDALHNIEQPTALNDVDVIYFDQHETDPNSYLIYQAKLTQSMPQLNWQVRNQARMHQRNGDAPYASCLDAMSYWPEKETAVAIRYLAPNEYQCVAAFGFESLLAGCISHNPKRSRKIFKNRLDVKGWLIKWPSLKVVY